MIIASTDDFLFFFSYLFDKNINYIISALFSDMC